MKYFLLYGLIGNWITGLFMTEETIKCLIAFVILIGGAIVCEMIFSSLKKKKQYLFCLGVLVAYIFIYGFVMIAVLLILYVIALMMESQDNAPKTTRTSKMENTERRNLVLLESYNSDKVMRAQRFNLSTPCCKTGACFDCKTPDTICCQILITRYSKTPQRIKVILVNEDLGF